MTKSRIAIVGAGAAGCFCAVNVKENFPQCEVFIFESGLKPMQKLALTGGGRCNLTNTFDDVVSLDSVYPRGEKLLKRLFYTFDQNSAVSWFESHDISLYAQDDHRVFPVSNSALDVVNKLQIMLNKLGVWLFTGKKVTAVKKSETDESLEICFSDSSSDFFDKVIVTTGGCSKSLLYQSLLDLGVEMDSPVPSLFSFKIKSNILTNLMGASVEHAVTKIAGTKFSSEGGLLVTHFGMSGPAVLKLSSYAARFLADNNYKCDLIVNWLGVSEDDIRLQVENIVKQNPNKNIVSVHPKNLTQRLWEYLVSKIEVEPQRKYSELGKKNVNKIVSILSADIYHVSGRGQFKDEFVTCGGVLQKSVNTKTLESKAVKNLYFAGEVLDIDGVTGGFNLQAAWTTAYVVASGLFD